MHFEKYYIDFGEFILEILLQKKLFVEYIL